MVHSDGLAVNLVSLILYYTESLIKERRFSEVSSSLDVAETMDKNLPKGQQFADQIAKLRKAAKQ
jgi:hypothetical protein